MAENVVRTAAERLRGHWFQGDLADGHGNRCAVGWLMQAAEVYQLKTIEALEDPAFSRALGLLNTAAVDKFPDRVDPSLPRNNRPHEIVQVNDHEDTDEVDVLAIFELAALRWDVEAG
jgi:hypothetical protein